MRALQSLLTRRQLLRGGAALGVTTLAPSLLLTACGGGSDGGSGGLDSADPAPGTYGSASSRESVALNFDLSAAPVANPRLQLHGSQSHGRALIAHSDETRAVQRMLNPGLLHVPDERLTHYLTGVDLPASAMQAGTVIGDDPTTGQPLLVMPFLHIPTTSQNNLATKRAKTPLVNAQPAGLLAAPTGAAAASSLPSLPAYNAAPRAVAVWLVFQHPAITNLDPDLGADIVDRINNLPTASNPYLSTLMYEVAMLLQKGYPTTSNIGSWAILVPRKNPDNTPVLDETGKQIYSYTINPTLATYTATVVKQILNSINNDPAFAGTNWQPSQGAPQQTAVAAAVAAAVASPSSSTFNVTNTLKVGSRTSGIRFKSISCADDRSVSIVVANEFLRSAGVFVQYFDASGTALPVDNPSELDTSRAKYLDVISPDAQIMGIPFLGDTAPTTTIGFTMPDDAAKAVVYYGGLGLGGADSFHGEALLGTIMTLVINLGLPMACLAFGLNETAHKGLSAAIDSAMADPLTKSIVLTGVKEAIAGGLGSNIQTAATTLSLQAFLSGIGETILDIFLACCPRISILIAAYIGESAVADAIPFVGAALWALSVLADVATIGETIVECVSCPAIDTNTITLTMPQQVSIGRDPNDYEFPATATRYQVVATYDGGASGNVVTGTVTKGTVGPIVVDLGQVASGGMVYVEATFFNASGCIVGYGKSQTLSNLPDTAAIVPLTIQEYLIPLDANTTYEHTSKLVYANGAHAWSTTGAPTQTRTSLQPGADNVLGALYGITVQSATGNAGYAFAAGGQGISVCSGNPAASLSSVRNVFLGDNPDSAAKFSNCGATQPMGIVYDPTGNTTSANNFFLQPGSDGFYHLRGVTLDHSNFDMGQTLTWGRFSNPLTSLCVLPSGYVIGVDRENHKMEVLQLYRSPSGPAQEATSDMFAAVKSGWGSQPGQLDTPVAVCAYGDRVLVLEQGNLRVQAFDHDGAAIYIFNDANGTPNATPIMALKDASASITYLDIAVEGTGCVYVLSYTGDGSSASNYMLDTYDATGAWITRTTGVAAGAIAVDLFRNVYTLNYEQIAGAPQVEPSLSQWLPYSTTPCAPATANVQSKGAAGAVPVSVCATNVARRI